MPTLPKPLQIAHRCEVSFGKTVTFAATPYEGQTAGAGAKSPSVPIGYSWDTIPSAQYPFLGSPPPTGTLAAGYSKDYANPRPDIRLLSAKGSGMGWTFTHEGRGKGQNYSQIIGNRSLRTVIYEARDNGDSAWTCFSGGHVASSIILPQGVSSRVGLNGENIITIQSATPDAFLANLTLPQMPYLLAGPANAERYKWYFMAVNGYDPSNPPNPLPDSTTRKASIQNILGYQLQGTGKGGIADGIATEPFAGFGTYRDQDTLTIGQLMQPVPANDLHFLNKLSTSRALVEILTNHVLANGRSLGKTFQLEVLTSLDPESDILHFEVSGSVNSIINEAAQHGVWRAWWDSRSGFHFIPDYYKSPSTNSLGGLNQDEFGQPLNRIKCTIKAGPSMIGELEIGKGDPNHPPVHSYRVRGQPFTSFSDATTDPMSNYYNMKLGAIYPVGASVQDNKTGGADPTFDNYMGKYSQVQAERLYRKSNSQTTFNWKNFPYPNLAFSLLNRVIIIQAKDPRGEWDFSTGKLFVVEQVSIDWKDDGRGGGIYLCSASGIEV